MTEISLQHITMSLLSEDTVEWHFRCEIATSRLLVMLLLV